MDLASRPILPLSFRKADARDVDAVVALVNSAYRGDTSRQGWTTEADLLGGQRTDADEVGALVATAGSMLLLAHQAEQLVGSVHLQRSGNGAWLGMFAVRPGLQGVGVGKHLMAAAEDTARTEWDATRMRMTVITLRTELIAFYERRGYRRTGELKPFPNSERFGQPRVAGLQLEVLEKKFDRAETAR